jgi:PPOX class probable F420-dependent enzyme
MSELPEWAKKLLAGRRVATLATQDADGSPHVTPVWFVCEDHVLYVGTPSWSRKAKNVVARPTATLLVDVRDGGGECWVSGTGPVTILRGAASQRMNAVIQRRYLTEAALNHPQVGPGFAAVDDITLCIQPTRWRSWASADVDRQFFGGILSADPKKWFRNLD